MLLVCVVGLTGVSTACAGWPGGGAGTDIASCRRGCVAASAFVCVHVILSVCVYMYGCVCVCMCKFMCVQGCAYDCVNVCMLCVCVCVCVCMYLPHLWPRSPKRMTGTHDHLLSCLQCHCCGY